jgi:hypothetical protein
MQLPKFGTSDKSLALLQTQWAQFLNPIISLPMLQQNTLTKVTLTAGVTNNINHMLGRELVGWMITRKRASATIYDTQDSNNAPQNTLQLITDNDVVVDLVVF